MSYLQLTANDIRLNAMLILAGVCQDQVLQLNKYWAILYIQLSPIAIEFEKSTSNVMETPCNAFASPVPFLHIQNLMIVQRG